MNKTAIKNFAIWARVQLIEAAKQRAFEYAITENGENDPELQSIAGRLLSAAERQQRRKLLLEIKQKGFQQVMEEVAYTWFNRFIALRFMEVNGYLPSKVRVFTDESGAFKPEILKEAMNVELDGLDRGLVLDLLDKQDNEALYKYLLIAQCNALNSCLPYMFEKLDSWTELLFPGNLLRQDSVIGTMVSSIPEADWTDAVQIIGWLYQYYNSELKDETFALLKKNVKITKERIPAATQLFTPDWIVRYMVENSLGRIAVSRQLLAFSFEKEEERQAKEKEIADSFGWKYYLPEAPQTPEVRKELTANSCQLTALSPQDLRIIDPCMGSGHILVYAFDVLMQLYTAAGWTERDAVKSIILNNLWGLDIDDRAAQLSYFAVMMKAQQYDWRFLSRQARNPAQPHVYAIQNSGSWMLLEAQLKRAYSAHNSLFAEPVIQTARALYAAFTDAKEYGSILAPAITEEQLDFLCNSLDDLIRENDLLDMAAQADATAILDTLRPLIDQCRALVQKYHVTVTNPPYMGSSGMGDKLSKYVKENYPDSKSDLFAVFIERIRNMLCENGYQAMITQHAWMFLPSYNALREKLIKSLRVCSLLHLGANAFEDSVGTIVQTVAFVLTNHQCHNYLGNYLRLVNEMNKEESMAQRVKLYCINQEIFENIPGKNYIYWINDSLLSAFRSGQKIGSYAEAKVGLQTGDNDRFLRMWFEVVYQLIGFGEHHNMKWIPYNKGGQFRKWYGNYDYIVNWENNGYEIKNFVDDKGKLRSRPQNTQYYFHDAITWSYISTETTFGARYRCKGSIFDVSGVSLFFDDDSKKMYILALLCSKVTPYITNMLNSTMNNQVGDIIRIPVLLNLDSCVSTLARDNIAYSHIDWDSFETSWDFQSHPLLPIPEDSEELLAQSEKGTKPTSLVSDKYAKWEKQCDDRFHQLKANEEELNRIFIDIYGLQDELTPEVEDKDVTVRRADLGRDIRSLISYAVGCMLGRYSLDKPGLAFAGGTWDDSQYKTYPADHDGILPITDDEYFDDDIVGRFVNWVRTVYGAETLEENLRFIADALGGKGTAREVIRNYFLNDFYADHLKIYQKRPIYWLFSSGKKNGFKCLIYMHRYQPDLLARIRTDYVHEQQERYRTQLQINEDALEKASPSERTKLNKQIAKLKEQAAELRAYEEKIHHLADQMIAIDLDDGVKVNYAKFADVLEKIK